jgi:hypothetical protein
MFFFNKKETSYGETGILITLQSFGHQNSDVSGVEQHSEEAYVFVATESREGRVTLSIPKIPNSIA